MEPQTETAPRLRPAVMEGVLEGCRRLHAVAVGAAASRSGFAAIGPHLRHCLDHFRCLLDGLGTGRVDYDARARDAELERDPGRFCRALGAIASELDRLDTQTLDRPLVVQQTAAPGRPPAATASSLGRELVFLSSHVIHHLEIMRRILQGFGLELPEPVALAFSTAAHRERLALPPG